MKLKDFDFDLPKKLIANEPLSSRTDSKLMLLNPKFHTKKFKELVGLLQNNDVIVVNDTKVIKARADGEKTSGAKVEVFLERVTSKYEAEVQTRSNSKIKKGDKILLKGKVEALCTKEALGSKYFKFNFPVREYFNEHGKVPLPPYIKRDSNENDIKNYQTVYANPEKEESVAAPTAGFHFDEDLLKTIAEKGIEIVKVTLHVGMGTFSPIRSENLDKQTLHSERIEVNEKAADLINKAKKNGGRVICIGTTSLRCLEGTIEKNQGKLVPYEGETNIFIKPGHEFKIVDCLITNFHLPKSSLFVLVSAFVGTKNIMEAYKWAVEKEYRFYSYGDAMFLELNQ